MAISTIGTDALASAAVTSAKLASGAPSRSQLPAGTVLQVVSTQITANLSVSVSSAGTFYDMSGFTASITPTSATSKILVLAMINQSACSSVPGRQYLQIVRNSTAIGVGDASSGKYQTTTAFYSTDTNSTITLPLVWLDSPATTSATTYKIQVTANGTATAYFNRGQINSQTDSAQTASQILLLEVAA